MTQKINIGDANAVANAIDVIFGFFSPMLGFIFPEESKPILSKSQIRDILAKIKPEKEFQFNFDEFHKIDPFVKNEKLINQVDFIEKNYDLSRDY